MQPEVMIGIAAAPIIVAIVNLFKPFFTADKWWPVLAVLAGVAWNVVVSLAYVGVEGPAIAQSGIVGFVVGLSASGLYAAGSVRGARAVLRAGWGLLGNDPGA